MTDQQLPPPGVHFGVPFADYLAWPAMSASTLKAGLDSMLHLKATLDGLMVKESPALALGSAVHCRLLEPGDYKRRYKVATPCMAELKSGDRKGETCGNVASRYDGTKWLCGTHGKKASEPPFAFISAAESLEIEAMAAAVHGHPVVKLLRQHGGFEASISWECRGVPCKSRLDKLIVGGTCPDTIIDLKTTRSGGAKPWRFEKAIRDYGYHISAAFYVDAIEAVADTLCHYIWVAVEKEPPYAVSVLQADDDWLRIGRTDYRKLLGEYKVCMESGEWPGYGDNIMASHPPDWMLKQYGSFLDG